MTDLVLYRMPDEQVPDFRKLVWILSLNGVPIRQESKYVEQTSTISYVDAPQDIYHLATTIGMALGIQCRFENRRVGPRLAVAVNGLFTRVSIPWQE